MLQCRKLLIRCYLSALTANGSSESQNDCSMDMERGRVGEVDGEGGEREESYRRTLAFVLDCVCVAAEPPNAVDM